VEAVDKWCRSTAWYVIFMGSLVACHAGCSRVHVHYVEDAPAFVRKAQGRMEIFDHCPCLFGQQVLRGSCSMWSNARHPWHEGDHMLKNAQHAGADNPAKFCTRLCDALASPMPPAGVAIRIGIFIAQPPRPRMRFPGQCKGDIAAKWWPGTCPHSPHSSQTPSPSKSASPPPEETDSAPAGFRKPNGSVSGSAIEKKSDSGARAQLVVSCLAESSPSQALQEPLGSLRS